MNTTMKHYQNLTFDDLIRSAQEGDGGAIAYMLLEAKYIDYTFNFHLRKAATKYFKYCTAELFDGLINDIYINLTKADFHAIRSFNSNNEHKGEQLKRIFFSWLMITASRHFNEVRRKYLSKPQSDIEKCVIAVAAEEYTGQTSDDIMLREAICRLKKQEQRLVLEQCLQPGKARRSVNVAKVLTQWRKSHGDMREADEAEVNCIKSRAYIELRAILLAMGTDRVMKKRVSGRDRCQG